MASRQNLHVAILVREKIVSARKTTPLIRFCGISALRLLMETACTLKPHSLSILASFPDEELSRELGDAVVGRIALSPREELPEAILAALSPIGSSEDAILLLDTQAPLISSGSLRILWRTKQRSNSRLALLTEKAAAIHHSKPNATEPAFCGVFIADTALLREHRQVPTMVEPSADPAAQPLSDRNKMWESLFLLGRFRPPRGIQASFTAASSLFETKRIRTWADAMECSRWLTQEKIDRLARRGVGILDPQTTYVDWECSVGKDTLLYPCVRLEGKTSIGRGCIVRSFSRITDCRLGAMVTVLEGCVLEQSHVKNNCRIGPFSHLRDQTRVDSDVQIGNYVELKKTSLGRGSKALHLSYLGDAGIGCRVNVGAGTITCNYDGFHKHRTVIEDDVFLGSDSQMVAPVHIGRGAFVAAGSTITEDVPADALAIARSRQVLKTGWAKKRKSTTGAPIISAPQS